MAEFGGFKWGLLAFLAFAFLFLPVVVTAATNTATPTPFQTDADNSASRPVAGERCLKAGDLCLPETNFTVTSVFDTATVAVGDWEKIAGKEGVSGWEQRAYGVLGYYGITKEQFDRANAAKSVEPQSLLLVVLPFLLIFFYFFCAFDVKSPTALFQQGSAEWGFLESVKEKIAPGWKLTDLFESDYKKSFHERIIAGLETPMFGRLLGDLGKKAAAGFSSAEAANASSKLGGINAKLQGQAKNVIRGVLMDVSTMMAAARYMIPMLLVFLAMYWIVTSILPSIDMAKDWVPLILIIYKLLAITFWAFWLWETIKFMLVRAGFLLAMVFPVSFLKLVYVPFTGGGIRAIARFFQMLGMMWVISAMKPAGMEPLSLVLGMAAAMSLYILLVFVVLVYGMFISTVATGVSAPFVALVKLLKRVTGAAATPPAPAFPAPNMDRMVLKAGPLNNLNQDTLLTKNADGTFTAKGALGSGYVFRSAEELKNWAESAGFRLGEWIGGGKKGKK